MSNFTTYELGEVIADEGGPINRGFPDQTVLVGIFDAARRNLAAADTAEVITLPAGTFVEHVFYEVLTADATQTLNVGDGVDPDGYVAAADVGTIGNSGIGGGALAAGKYYAAADTIDIEVPATKAFDTLKVKVYVVCTILGLAS